MKKEIKDRWVKALRSGDYPQGKEALAQDGKFCCLGVLCDLAAKAGVVKEYTYDYGRGPTVVYGAEGTTALLPKEVMKWAGLNTPGPHINESESLTGMNDTFGADFNTIADAIENTPDGWDGLVRERGYDGDI